MIRTQISLDPEDYRAAREEARRCGISFAELVRRALARRLAKRRGEPAWASFAGAVEDGDPDASTSVDKVVYGRETL
jgi:hypothetical protein